MKFTEEEVNHLIKALKEYNKDKNTYDPYIFYINLRIKLIQLFHEGDKKKVEEILRREGLL